MSGRHQLVLLELDAVNDGVGGVHDRAYRVWIGHVDSLIFLLIEVVGITAFKIGFNGNASKMTS
jgi:hypothetical protein